MHCANDSDTTYGDLQLTTFGQNPAIPSAAFLEDWKGPEDRQEHLEAAVAAVDEPPGYWSTDRGLMIARSDWSEEAVQLLFQARAQRFGHQLADRGYFVVDADGRTWLPYAGGKAYTPEFHSLVLVDGAGPSYTPARSVAYVGVQDAGPATVDVAIADLTPSYANLGGGQQTLNDFRLQPDPNQPWMDLPISDLPNWYTGERMSGWAPPPETGEFARAHRVAALARGPHPYVLISDDIAQDETVRTYTWGVVMPGDVVDAQWWSSTGNTAVLDDPQDPTRHLWIYVASTGAPGEFVATEYAETFTDGDAQVTRLERSVVGSAARFRTIIYPYRDGDPVPSVTSSDGTLTVTLDGHVDVWTFTTPASADPAVSMTRDGAEQVNTANN